MLRRAEAHFGGLDGTPPPRRRPAEPLQIGERRVLLERDGTTAYLKFAWHAPAAEDPDFFPMLVLDAALTGAKGVNIWSSFRGAPPQRRARLYTTLVERGLASVVAGSLLPTKEPFLYNVSLTAMEGVPLAALEEAATQDIERVRAGGLNEDEVARAKRQLRARLVFEDRQRDQHRAPARLLRHRGGAGARGAGLAGTGRYRRTGDRCRCAPSCPRQANGRLVPAGGAPLMAHAATSGLSPARHVLANGVVVIVQETAFSPP